MKGLFFFLLISILFFLPKVSIAQTDTNFWFAAPNMSIVNTSYDDRPVFLRIYSTGSVAKIKISEPANSKFTTITTTIAANSSYSVDLSSSISYVENSPGDSILNYGILIQSDVPVTAYYELDNALNSLEIFNLKGKIALGKNFYTPFQTTYPNATRTAFQTYPPYSSFNIVATEDNTKVTITPTNNIVGHASGNTFTKTLNKGQSYAAIAKGQSSSSRLAGSKVTSDKPIAITVCDDELAIDPSADAAGDQIVPIEILGQEYIVIKGFANKDYIYVLATVDNTKVYFDGTYQTTINKGVTFASQLTDSAIYINTSSPTYVLHLTGSGDELAEALVPPIQCTGSSRISFTHSSSRTLSMMVFTKSGNENYFTLNGSGSAIPGSLFKNVPGTSGAWVYAIAPSISTTLIASGALGIIKNSKGLFHASIIEGDATYGSEYGSFVEYGSLNLGQDITTCNTSVSLDGGFGRDSYLWSDGSKGRFLNVTKTGTYYAKTSLGSCTYYDTINVKFLNLDTFSIGKDTNVCGVDSFVLKANISDTAYKIKWLDSSIKSSFVVKKSGKYWAKVKGPCGTRTDTVKIVLHPNPTVNLGPDKLICNGSNLTISPVVSDSALKYTWQDGTNKANYIVKKTGKYWVKVNTYCGSSGDTINITVSNTLNVNLRPDTMICPSDSILLNPTLNDTSAKLKWQDGSAFRTHIAKPDNKYWVKATNNCGSSSDTVTINSVKKLSVNLGPDKNICDGDSIILKPVISDTTAEIIWQDGSPSKSFVVRKQGTYWVEVKNKCQTVYDTIKIFDGISPVILLKDSTICGLKSISLSAKQSVSSTYLWSTGETTSSGNFGKSGKYWVEVNNGCIVSSDSFKLTFIPDLKLPFDTFLCKQDSFLIDVIRQGATYLWNDGTKNGTHVVNKAGTYKIRLKDGICTFIDSVIVNPLEKPNIFLYKDTSLCENDSILLQIFNLNTTGVIEWQDSSNKATYMVKRPGKYYVTVKNVCGTSSDTVNVGYKSCDCIFAIPTAFTPGKVDGLNDFFSPLGCNMPLNYYKLYIYNRWGELLFESNDRSRGWDGKFQNKLCEEGEYLYKFQYTDKFGNSKAFKGTVMLFKN